VKPACTEDGALKRFQRYTQGGNAALEPNMDKHHPAVVGETFASFDQPLEGPSRLFARTRTLSARVSEKQNQKTSNRVLLGESKFWTQATLRVVQAIVYRGPRSTDPAYAVAVKQLYASHYFETRSGFDRLRARQESPDRASI